MDLVSSRPTWTTVESSRTAKEYTVKPCLKKQTKWCDWMDGDCLMLLKLRGRREGCAPIYLVQEFLNV